MRVVSPARSTWLTAALSLRPAQDRPRRFDGLRVTVEGRRALVQVPRIGALMLLLLITHAASAAAATLFDPARHFRILSTEHFVIYFHQGEDRSAERLARIAEDAWQALRAALDAMPPRQTHVVLVDQSELANGWANPLPYDLVVITAAWPPGSDFIGRTDDWLRLVFTHEFTHITHLDRSRRWARVVRSVFGRLPLAFPNLFLPTWQIEGLATFEESRITGNGRLDAADFRAVEREAAARRMMEPLDRVSGGLTDWPGGLGPYAYGAGFHQYLASHYGDASLAAMADKTAGRVPYTASRVFKSVYGRSLGELWREYEAATISSAVAGPPDVDPPTQLTRHGFAVLGPRFLPARCSTCPGEIAYSVRTPDAFPALNAIEISSGRSHRLATRYLGSTVGASRDAIIFDQQDIHRNVGIYSDLFVLDRPSGRVRRLTSGARLLDPDLSPDGESIVCVREANGRRELVLVRLTPDSTTASAAVSEIVTVASDPDTQFNAPRWSPDGRSIAVERHRRGELSEIVVIDVETKELRVVAAPEGARAVTPAWRRDGAAIVAAVDLEGDTFNLYEFDLPTGERRQLTHVTGGATWPDISSDGNTLVFVGYTTHGFDLFTMPYPEQPSRERIASLAERSTPPSLRRPAGASAEAADRSLAHRATTALSAPLAELSDDRSRANRTGGEDASHDRQLDATSVPGPRPYSPWTTLPPTSWTPVIESTADQLRGGFATGAYDVLGYHAWAFSATWLVSGPAASRRPSAATPDWQFAYAYDRWQPTLFASVSSRTSFFAGPPDSSGLSSNSTLRARELEAGVLMPFRRVRHTHRAFLSLLKSSVDYQLPEGPLAVDRSAARLGWATTTAHVYGYSVSLEGGIAAGSTLELVRHALGASDEATTATADLRAYIRGVAEHHVVAIRGGAGTSSGARTAERAFLLGGAGPNSDVLAFDHDAFSLLRGFPFAAFAGTHVALVNADYRWPIARPQRGIGTFPLFLNTVHAAVFADAGHAWTRTFRAQDVKTSFGGELSATVVAGYAYPFTLTVGTAWGRDGSRIVRDGATAYVRIGRAF